MMSLWADRAFEGEASKRPPRTIRQSSLLTGTSLKASRRGGRASLPDMRGSSRCRKSRPGTTPTGSPACRRGRTRWARAGRPGRAGPASSTRSRRSAGGTVPTRRTAGRSRSGPCKNTPTPPRSGAGIRRGRVPLRELRAGLDLVREERFEPGLPAQPVAVADRLVPGNPAGRTVGVGGVPTLGHVVVLVRAVLLDGGFRRGDQERTFDPALVPVFVGEPLRLVGGRPHAKHERAAEEDQVCPLGPASQPRPRRHRAWGLARAGGDRRERAPAPAADEQLGGGVDAGVAVVEVGLAGVFEDPGTEPGESPSGGVSAQASRTA